MRKILLGLTAVVGLAIAFAASPAAADPYKWCGDMSGGMGSANCGYTTREQCEASMRADGGFCRPNGFYTGDSEKLAKRERKRSPS